MDGDGEIFFSKMFKLTNVSKYYFRADWDECIDNPSHCRWFHDRWWQTALLPAYNLESHSPGVTVYVTAISPAIPYFSPVDGLVQVGYTIRVRTIPV